jgi:hypothetical protein
MSSAFPQHRAAKCAVLAIAACALVEALAADESVGTYSGDYTLNNEPVHVDLEIVKNEGYQNGGDAILSISKSDGTSSPVHLTMTGGYRDIGPAARRAADSAPPETRRVFGFRTMDVSETLGGRLAVQLTQEGAQLKGTLDFQPVRDRQSRNQAAVQVAQPARVPLVLTRSSLAKPGPKLAAQLQTPTALNPGEITGVYEGTLTANKRQFFAQLRLSRERTNDLSGELIFSATASDAAPLGSFKLKGKLDPANSTFKLSSGGELTSSDGLMLAEADGNFDPSTGKIRAQLSPNEGTLELTRNGPKSAELQAKRSESAKRLTEGPVNLAEATTDDERRDAIVRWFIRLKAEYPDVDLHHTVLNELYPKVLNLFGGDDFVPVFGKPFDAMTLDDRNYVKQLFRRLFTQPNTRDLLDGFGDYLGRPFVLATGSFSYADVAPQLAFRRTIRKQWHETMERLRSLSPTSVDYDELLSLEKKGKEPFHDLWPSEFKQFQEAVESTKHRLADGVATDRLNAAISSASGLDGARSLASWAEQQKELLEYVSENVRQQLTSRISAKIGEHIEPLLREEAEAVAALGDGVEAVNAGNKWYGHLHTTYGFAAGHPAFQAAVGRLKARRSGDLTAAQLDIMEEIEKQSTEKGVDNVKAKYFAVPGDNQTPAATAVARAATERKQAIQLEQALARYSPHEQQWLRPDGRIQIPKEIPPPDEDDLRVAIVRTLEMMGGTRRDPFTVEWSNQITKAFGAYPIITINKVDELACEPAPGGYLVNYRVHMTIDYPDNLKRMMNSQPSFGGAMMQQLTRQINGPHGTQEGHFELTERGWWCPTMQEHGLGSSD